MVRGLTGSGTVIQARPTDVDRTRTPFYKRPCQKRFRLLMSQAETAAGTPAATDKSNPS